MAGSATCISDQNSCPADENSPHPKRRNKYVSQACVECKKRKLRCDGSEPCRRCLTSRNRRCTYTASRLHRPGASHILPCTDLVFPEAIGCSTDETFTSDSRHNNSSLDHRLTLLNMPMVQGNDLPTAQPPRLDLHHLPVLLDLDPICPQPNPPLIPSQPERSLQGSNYESTSLVQAVDLESIVPFAPQLHTEENQWTDTGQQHSFNVHVLDSGYTFSQLYPNQKTSSLLKCWFDELETYYPCIDRADFYDRLSNLFVAHCECRDGMTRIPKQPQHVYLAALACGMMSLAAYFGGDLEPSQQHQEDEHCLAVSISWYLESRKLLECIQQSTYEPSLDLLRLQIVYVLYMTIHADSHGMCRSMTIAVDLAFALELNDESTWMSLSAGEKEYRRLLWWTVYHMDRRVALRSGRSILIHDASFVVDDFSTESKAIYLGTNPSASRSVLAANKQSLSLQWEAPSDLTTEWFDYLLFTTRWSRLVSHVWNKVLSLKAVKRPDIAMLAKADEYLIQLHRNMPTTLFWNSDHLPYCIRQGCVDTMFRLRLISFEMINCLRLLLRTRSINNQLRQHLPGLQKSPGITEAIASNTIESIVRYLSARKHARPWATYAGLRIVELSHDIATVIKSQEFEPTEMTYKVVTSISWAQRCLENMNMRASYVAAGKLATLLRDVNRIVNTRIPKLITFSGEQDPWSGDVDEYHSSSEAITRDFDEPFWLDTWEDGLQSSQSSDFW